MENPGRGEERRGEKERREEVETGAETKQLMMLF